MSILGLREENGSWNTICISLRRLRMDSGSLASRGHSFLISSSLVQVSSLPSGSGLWLASGSSNSSLTGEGIL